MSTRRDAPAYQPVLVLKWGGAAITDKSRHQHVEMGALARLSGVVAHMHSKGVPLVLVHGAGSCGHWEVKEHGLNSVDAGVVAGKTALGFAATTASLSVLSTAVLRALVAAGVPAIPISILPRGRFMPAVVDALHHGCVPVLHGNVVLDDAMGARAMSGDEVMEGVVYGLQGMRVGAPWHTGKTLMAPSRIASDAAAARVTSVRVAFVTDVPAVLTAPPTSDALPPPRPIAIIPVRPMHHATTVGTGATTSHGSGGGAHPPAWLCACASAICLSHLPPRHAVLRHFPPATCSTIQLASEPTPPSPARAGGGAAGGKVDTTGGMDGKLSAAIRMAMWHALPPSVHAAVCDGMGIRAGGSTSACPLPPIPVHIGGGDDGTALTAALEWLVSWNGMSAADGWGWKQGLGGTVLVGPADSGS